MTRKFRTRGMELKTERSGDTLRLRVRGSEKICDEMFTDAVLRALRECCDAERWVEEDATTAASYGFKNGLAAPRAPSSAYTRSLAARRVA